MSILHVRHCLNFSAFIDFSIPHCNIEVKWSESHSVVSDSLWSHGLYCPWHSPGQNTGVGSLSLLQRIFPTQGSNPGLPHCSRFFTSWNTREAQEIFFFLIKINDWSTKKPVSVTIIRGPGETLWRVETDRQWGHLVSVFINRDLNSFPPGKRSAFHGEF